MAISGTRFLSNPTCNWLCCASGADAEHGQPIAHVTARAVRLEGGHGLREAIHEVPVGTHCVLRVAALNVVQLALEAPVEQELLQAARFLHNTT